MRDFQVRMREAVELLCSFWHFGGHTLVHKSENLSLGLRVPKGLQDSNMQDCQVCVIVRKLANEARIKERHSGQL